MFLISCGDKESSRSSSGESSSPIEVKLKASKLTKYMDKASVCDLVSTDTTQKLFNTSKEISFNASGYASKRSSSVTCNYSWERADVAERKEKFMTYTIDQMQGKVEKIPMRKRALEHNFSVRLEEYKGSPEQFMPAKLTEEQLQRQIASAKEMAAKRLTDEQKKVAGNAANSMMEKLLRQNNENIKIDGVGDSAYWTAVGGGSLVVLSGDMKLSISPMIGDDLEQDMENAKNIALLVLQ